jgi:hypothetical protein
LLTFTFNALGGVATLISDRILDCPRPLPRSSASATSKCGHVAVVVSQGDSEDSTVQNKAVPKQIRGLEQSCRGRHTRHCSNALEYDITWD